MIWSHTAFIMLGIDDEREDPLLLFTERVEVFQCIERLRIDEDTLTRDISLRRLRVILDKYQECKVLLDASLESMVQALSVHRDSPYALSALYSLCKVRGYKIVQRFLPHGVTDVQDIWTRCTSLQQQDLDQQEQQDQQQADIVKSTATISSVDEPPIWESQYVLWIWMAALSLVPFDCSVLLEDTFPNELFDAVVANFTNPGILRQAAAVCLASWLSRPDWQMHLLRFIQLTTETIDRYICKDKVQEQQNLLFRVLAVLQTCVTLLKRQDPTTVVPSMQPLCLPMRQLANDCHSSTSALLQKYLIKWWTRWSCALLPPPCAWRYQQGQRSLFGVTTKSIASQTTPVDIVEQPPEPALDTSTNDDLFPIPDEVEENMGALLHLMSHSATAVRWSAAKGIGRITERLPALCAHDILDAVLESLTEDMADTDDTAWHGACLTLAELARRGLILPQWLPEVVPYILRALQLERPSRHSAGAGVRDAACYTYWAFARAYKPMDLKPFLPELNESIVLMSLFDRQVNCRRAASAAFQEAVGRQGATNVPHGLDILTLADYFSLGNRTNAYLVVAKEIALLDSLYRRSILRHLYTSKLNHWDSDIRTLSSKTLNELALLDSNYTHETILPTLLDKSLDLDVATRHGAICGLAEIIDAISRDEDQRIILISTSRSIERLINVVPEIERRRLYRGRGGELVRGGVCRLVECFAKAKIPLSVKNQVRLLDSIDANVSHPCEATQLAACQSIESLLTSYFPVGIDGPSARLQARVINKFVNMASTSDNPAATRGYSLALGYLPAKLLAPSRETLLMVLNCLKSLANPKATVGGEGDAETRRSALIALGRIVTIVGFDIAQTPVRGSEHSYPQVVLDNALLELVFQTYLGSLSDYKTDRRGDVGSWCRMEAMSGVTALLKKLATSDRIAAISSGIVSGVVCAALRQMAEKLDLVRDRCSMCLEELLLCSEVPIVHREIILKIPVKVKSDQPWRDAIKPYTELIKLAEIMDYTESIMLGFTASIGGLGESQSKAAWEALLYWIRTQDLAIVERIGQCCLNILDQNGGRRLFVPALATLDRLLSHRCLHDLIDQTDFSKVCAPRLISACATTKSVPRILAAVDAMISLTAVCDGERHCSERKLLLGCLCRLLNHSIPRVRKLVADSFYLLLLDLHHVEAAEQVMGMSWMTPSIEKTEEIAKSLNIVDSQ